MCIIDADTFIHHYPNASVISDSYRILARCPFLYSDALVVVPCPSFSYTDLYGWWRWCRKYPSNYKTPILRGNLYYYRSFALKRFQHYTMSSVTYLVTVINFSLDRRRLDTRFQMYFSSLRCHGCQSAASHSQDVTSLRTAHFENFVYSIILIHLTWIYDFTNLSKCPWHLL